jgi:hypothetical protein
MEGFGRVIEWSDYVSYSVPDGCGMESLMAVFPPGCTYLPIGALPQQPWEAQELTGKPDVAMANAISAVRCFVSNKQPAVPFQEADQRRAVSLDLK